MLIKFVNNLGNCNIIEFTCGVDNEVVLKDEQEIVLDVKDGDIVYLDNVYRPCNFMCEQCS